MGRHAAPEHRCRGIRFAKSRRDPLLKPCRAKATVGPWCYECANDRKRQQSLIDVLETVPDWPSRLVGNEKRKPGRPSAFQGLADNEKGIIAREEHERAVAGKPPDPPWVAPTPARFLPLSTSAPSTPIASPVAFETKRPGGARPAGSVVPANVPVPPERPSTPAATFADPPYQTPVDKARAHLDRVARRVRR